MTELDLEAIERRITKGTVTRKEGHLLIAEVRRLREDLEEEVRWRGDADTKVKALEALSSEEL